MAITRSKPSVCCDRLGKNCEPARDERRDSTVAPHRCDQGARARGQPDPCSGFFEQADFHALEQGDARFERCDEVDLAIHCPAGDFGNSRAKPEGLGELFEHLILDNRQLKIGDKKPLAPRGSGLNENIDRRAIDQGTRGFFGLRRMGIIKDEVAGLRCSEPDWLAADAQGLGDHRDEAGEARPAASASDQGEHHAHEPASYSRKPAGYKQPPVLVIAGPTASGKSALALELADAFGGTIINSDSLQVYRDLRILTSRPDIAAEQRAAHRLYGFLDASERGSVADWRRLALDEIAIVTAVGRLPILVGGTGLYIRALEKGLAPVPEIPEEIRREAVELHRALGGAAFRERLAQLDPCGAPRPAAGDTQRLVRAYEVVRATGVPLATWQRRPQAPSPYRFAVILLAPPRERLYAACDTRFTRMMAAGALVEAAALAARDLGPRFAGDEGGRPAGTLGTSARGDSTGGCDRCGSACH